jgi:hypothetical protein
MRACILFEYLGLEAAEFIVLHGIADLDWIAADFTVFDIGLTADREVQNHRNFFAAIGASEEMFHEEVPDA